MKRARAMGWCVALVVLAAVAALVLRPGHGVRPPRPPAAPTVRAPPAVAPGRPAALTRRAAIRVARRFARAYARWDAGQRADSARGLAQTTTADLLAELARAHARPTARPPRALALVVLAAARRADAAYEVALGPRHPYGAHALTVVVTGTAAGPRVAAIAR